jgi:MFS family permease
MPAQQALVNDLVPRVDLPPAVALAAVAFNVARAAGLALAGAIAAWLGSAAHCWRERSVFRVDDLRAARMAQYYAFDSRLPGDVAVRHPQRLALRAAFRCRCAP